MVLRRVRYGSACPLAADEPGEHDAGKKAYNKSDMEIYSSVALRAYPISARADNSERRDSRTQALRKVLTNEGVFQEFIEVEFERVMDAAFGKMTEA